MKEVLMESQ